MNDLLGKEVAVSTETYNKLVRDKIPDIIRGDGQIPHTRLLTDFRERDAALRQKLFEESREVVDASSVRNLITEIADVLDAANDLMKLHHIGAVTVERERLKRRRERGGFDNFVFLESIETSEESDGQR